MLKEKRKANGNLTRRPPARLIAIYKVFKVSLKPFQRLGGVRGGSPEKKLTALSFGLNGLGLIGRSTCYMEVFILGAEVLIHEATF